MKIFITGFNGFLGKSLRTQLSKECKIISLVRKKNQIKSAANILEVKGDLKNPKDWIGVVKDFAPDYCINLAWDGLPDYSLKKCSENIKQHLDLLEILVEISIKKIVVAGSCWEYGKQSGTMFEDTKTINPSLFGLSKTSIFSLYDYICKENNIDYFWSRIFFCYGPNQRSQSIIPTIWRNIRFDQKNPINFPNTYQDYIYVDDVIKALTKMIKVSSTSGIYNIGSSKLNSVAEIAKIIYSYYDLASPFEIINKNKVEGIKANITKIRTTLKWEPKITLKEGIIKTLKDLDKVNGFN